jgi:hypothetical protein
MEGYVTMRQETNYLTTHRQSEWTTDIEHWLRVNLNNYLTKSKNVQSIIDVNHIIDYFLSTEAPKRLKKMSFEEVESNVQRWDKKLQNSKIKEEGEIKIIDTLNEYSLVLLVDEKAYQREGAMMKHCVGGYYGNSNSTIYSLRDSNNVPHATIEVQGNKVHQIQGVANSTVKFKYIEPILYFIDQLKVDVDDYTLSRLGYAVLEKPLLDAGFKEFILKKFPAARFLKIREVEYVEEGSLK